MGPRDGHEVVDMRKDPGDVADLVELRDEGLQEHPAPPARLPGTSAERGPRHRVCVPHQRRLGRRRDLLEPGPVVEDDVVIYAGATILGRITIGRGSSIGGNVWLTRSVPPESRITQAQARSDVFADGAGI